MRRRGLMPGRRRTCRRSRPCRKGFCPRRRRSRGGGRHAPTSGPSLRGPQWRRPRRLRTSAAMSSGPTAWTLFSKAVWAVPVMGTAVRSGRHLGGLPIVCPEELASRVVPWLIEPLSSGSTGTRVVTVRCFDRRGWGLRAGEADLTTRPPSCRRCGVVVTSYSSFADAIHTGRVTTRYVLLGLLHEQPGHGYDLKQRYDKRFPRARPLAYAQVYATVQRLVRDGLAEVDSVDINNRPKRTFYRITEEGRRELTKWSSEAFRPYPFIVSEIFIKMVLAIDCEAGGGEGDPVGYLKSQQAAHLSRRDELIALASSPDADTTAALSVDYALSHLDADLRWMAGLAIHMMDLLNGIEGGKSLDE